MSGFLILDPRPVYFTQTGEAAAGGSLVFSMAGTATPQDVYGDAALTVNNGSTLTLGTDGRTSVEVWGDPTLSYRVQLYDANGALQFDQDNVSGGGGGGAGGSIPALLTGKFLTNDGSQLLWADIRQLPDPTGQSGKVLSTDGENFTWITKPADGAAGAAGTNASVTVTATSVKWSSGSGDMAYIQSGSDSAPASGTHTTSKSITFPVAFKGTPKVFVNVTSSTFASAGYLANDSVTGQTTTGFNVSFDTNSSDGSNGNIVSALTFDWIAFGTIGA
jgi:hypothetical protein